MSDINPTVLVGKTIDNGSLILLSVLGTGSFATVYYAESTNSSVSTPFAVKAIPLCTNTEHEAHPHCTSHRSLQEHNTYLEPYMHSLLNLHPGIIKLHKTCEEYGFLFLIMDYYPMDLYEAITSTGGFSDEAVKDVFGEICEAVIYMHSNNVYHRDLKPENILIAPCGTGSLIAITDFGLATQQEISNDFGTGTTRYMPPEAMSSTSSPSIPSLPLPSSPKTKFSPTVSSPILSYSSSKHDVWSLGVILINLLFGRNPWHAATKEDALFGKYMDGDINIIQTTFSLTDEFWNVLKPCFAINPSQRCTVHELYRGVLSVTQFTIPSRFSSPSCSPSLTPLPLSSSSHENVNIHNVNNVTSNVHSFNTSSPPIELDSGYGSTSESCFFPSCTPIPIPSRVPPPPPSFDSYDKTHFSTHPHPHRHHHRYNSSTPSDASLSFTTVSTTTSSSWSDDLEEMDFNSLPLGFEDDVLWPNQFSDGMTTGVTTVDASPIGSHRGTTEGIMYANVYHQKAGLGMNKLSTQSHDSSSLEISHQHCHEEKEKKGLNDIDVLRDLLAKVKLGKS